MFTPVRPDKAPMAIPSVLWSCVFDDRRIVRRGLDPVVTTECRLSCDTLEEHREMQDSTHDTAPRAVRNDADISTRRGQSPKAGSSAVLLTAGGLVAAFGAAACCGLPLVLAGLG